jgi:hypothetical protein
MPSSSRPYQSKILRFVLSQFQQGVERHRRAFRQVRSAATWGVQLALSPVYAVLRAARLAGRQLGQATPKRLPLLNWFRQGAIRRDEPLPGEVSAVDLGAKPIGQILELAVQCLEPAQTSALQLTSPTLVARVRQWLVPQSTRLATISYPTLQGIASDLETHAILLVGMGNQLWAVLTPVQQSYLKRQIWSLVKKDIHLRTQTPVVQSPLLGRFSGLGFGRLRRFLGWEPMPFELGLTGAVTSEALIVQFLTDVQRALPPEQIARCLLPPQGRAPLATGLLECQQNRYPESNRPGIIQGIASDLETQALVLVGEHNLIWDVLTPHQQGYLKQQIWALIDAYGRPPSQVFSFKQRVGRVVTGLPLPDRWKRLLMESSSSPVFGGLPSSDRTGVSDLSLKASSDGELGVDSGKLYFPWLLSRIAGLLGKMPGSSPGGDSGVTDRLPLPVPSPILLGSRLPWSRRWMWLPTLPERILREPATLIRVQTSTPVPQPSSGVTFGACSLPESPDFEIEVTSMEYIEHPLEKLLRWVDGALSWLESAWRWFRTWWQSRRES